MEHDLLNVILKNWVSGQKQRQIIEEIIKNGGVSAPKALLFFSSKERATNSITNMIRVGAIQQIDKADEAFYILTPKLKKALDVLSPETLRDIVRG